VTARHSEKLFLGNPPANESDLWNMNQFPTRDFALGGFQLLDLIITELKSHMTCKKFKVSHWWKFYLSKINKICSPV
jgi:hypothetical protein